MKYVVTVAMITDMTTEQAVVIISLLTLGVIIYQTRFLFQHLAIVRKQDDIFTRQLGLKPDLRVYVPDEAPLQSDSRPGEPGRYRLQPHIVNKGTKAASDCHVFVYLPVIWHEAAANARGKPGIVGIGHGNVNIEGTDYYSFDLTIDKVNADDHHIALGTVFTGSPGTEIVLWTISCSDGNFPAQGFGRLEVRLA